jgi:hypothetical protein
MKKFFFCLLKVTEERGRLQSWIRIRMHQSEVRILSKISLIPNTAVNTNYHKLYRVIGYLEKHNWLAKSQKSLSFRRLLYSDGFSRNFFCFSFLFKTS